MRGRDALNQHRPRPAAPIGDLLRECAKEARAAGTARLLEPRLETPVPDASLDTQHLPDTLLSEQVTRVRMATIVGGALWSYGLAMDSVVRPFTVGATVPFTNLLIEIASMAFSAVMFLHLRSSAASLQKKSDTGLLYMVANAWAVAMLNSWAQPPTEAINRVSWTTIVILVSAMIMPTSPRKMLVGSLVAASMDPLVVWIGHLRGLPTLSVVATFVYFAPNYACAMVATWPSSALQRLGRRLRQAQEMGSYHLVERLGRGGMGEVWRAHHRLLARDAAVKLVRPELLGAADDTETLNMLRRFEREAQATATLSSPHTIRLFDFGVTDNRTFYYAMELLDGRDLESLVTEFGPVPAERAVYILEQVAHSLADAHARGLVHRDITPSNIYACRLGLEYDFVKVLDFGLVTFNDQRSVERRLFTGTHVTTGTPAFLAPEIILEGEVDARADVYAFGCVAYYLLTGQLVFDAETPMKMFVQHLHAPAPLVSERTELPIPPELEALVMSCLEKDPRRRPQSASDLQQRLRQCRTSRTWDNNAARRWWDLHLTELTGSPTTTQSHIPELARV